MARDDPLRLVLVEDHAVVRAGLRRLLESQPGWTVVAEAADRQEALAAVLEHEPDVLVLDITLADGSCLDAIPGLKSGSPGTRIVVLTMHAEASYASDALHAGAIGYVLKEAAVEELIEAIRRALDGRSYLSPRIRAKLEAASSRSAAILTAREREVLQLLALGHTNVEIAEMLFLSRRTVESHRGSIQRKLHVSTRAELTRWAHEHGLVRIDDLRKDRSRTASSC